MAYNGANLSLLTGTRDGGYNEWVYKSADTFTTVKAANFISDAVARGMKIGDKLTVVDTSGPAQTITMVLTVPAAGATVSQTGVVPST